MVNIVAVEPPEGRSNRQAFGIASSLLTKKLRAPPRPATWPQPGQAQ